jgi:hypothetical protein
MQRDPRACLWDVREAALTIQGFVAGLDATAYAAPPLVLACVQALLRELGEF